MTDDVTPAPALAPGRSLFRKLVIPMGTGMVVGGVSAFFTLSSIDALMASEPDLSIVAAAMIALLYLVIGLSVGLGTLSPGFGAHFLNVEDADELREMRRALLASSAAMALMGAALMVLVLAAPAGPVPGPLALVLGGAGLLAGGALGYASQRMADELLMAVGLEANAYAYMLALLAIGGWAMAAHVGLAAGPEPLDLLTTFYALALVATLIATGRRGMLKLR